MLWFRLHAPQVTRGQLTLGLGFHASKVSPWMRLFMALQLGNVLTRPDFVAQDIHSAGPLFRVARRVWHIQTAYWTVRTEADLTAAGDAAVITETTDAAESRFIETAN